jgi:PilZ domain
MLDPRVDAPPPCRSRTTHSPMQHPPRERRRAPRAQADFPIHLAPHASAGAARLKDISEIGLCCEFGAPVQEMTMVAIDLELPGEAEQHRVKGAVVRCDPVRGSKKDYEIAVYFTDVGAPTRAILRSIVAAGKPV